MLLRMPKSKTVTFCYLKKSEGGVSRQDIIDRLASRNIPARPTHCIYVGMWAIEVPARYERRVDKLLFG